MYIYIYIYIYMLVRTCICMCQVFLREAFLKSLIHCFRFSDPRLECTLTEDGSEYNGTIGKTISGNTCQRWDTDLPHVRNSDIVQDMNNFPEATLAEVVNYCRQSSAAARPWCYTTNPSVRWEYCNIPRCKRYYSTSNSS